jgi:large subunit ribosomal protein L24
MHIKTGDNVKVITGKDKGLTGKVLKAFPREDKLIVEGINLKKRHEKPRQEGKKGQIVERAHPIHVSNVMKTDEAKAEKKAPKKAEAKETKDTEAKPKAKKTAKKSEAK